MLMGVKASGVDLRGLDVSAWLQQHPDLTAVISGSAQGKLLVYKTHSSQKIFWTLRWEVLELSSWGDEEEIVC